MADDGDRSAPEPDIELLTGPSLDLEPLTVQHADEMHCLLDDPALHAFTGGSPAGLEELRERYARQADGRSPDGSQRWLNWVVRHRDTSRAVGAVQATVTTADGRCTAEVAWVIARPHQRRGHASEAAHTMAAWLRARGVHELVAHVHPAHSASAAVARALGLVPTGTVVDGEVRWTG